MVVSRAYDDDKTPTLKSHLLHAGYAGPGEDEFDEIMRDIRGDTAGLFVPRPVDEDG